MVGGYFIAGSAAAALPHTPHTTDRQTGLGPSRGCGVLRGAGWFVVELVELGCVLSVCICTQLS